jgi:hypothetical protein
MHWDLLSADCRRFAQIIWERKPEGVARSVNVRFHAGSMVSRTGFKPHGGGVAGGRGREGMDVFITPSVAGRTLR